MKPTTRRDEILSVAAKLFKDRGYSAVSVRDIADILNIKAASLYYHVQSKQEILSLIIIEVAERFTLGMNEIVDSDVPSAKKIEKFIELHVAITIGYAPALACLNKDWMHLEGASLAYFLRMREDYERNFRNILKLGIKEGDIKDLDVEITLFSLLSTLRTLYLWYSKKGKITQKTLTEQLKRILLEGIVTQS